MLPQQYCLKWKYHNANIQSTFSTLRDKANYCDVTLWSGGAAMRAHRAVLAACSGLFADLLASHDPSLGEPAIVLTDSVHAHHLRHLLAFMYTGEVSVHHAELTSLLKTAEDLRIKGLADVSWRDQSLPLESSSGDTTEISSAPTSPSDSRIPTDSKSDENKDDDKPKINTEKSKTSSMSVTSIPAGCVNGSSLLMPMMIAEPKRRRGRPPLDTKLINAIDNDLLIADPPKRPKLMSSAPNILRKSRIPASDKNASIVELATNWANNVNSSTNNDNDGEGSEGADSEASLDGQDISEFLDTTMMEDDSPDVKISGKPMVVMPSENPLADEAGPSNIPAKDMFSDVVKLSDYLLSGRRTQFWAEDYVKRVMEAVFCRELEMKQAAEILGVSYGTLYGRYRDTFGCINRPYRAREFWSENSDILAKLQRKEITFMKAAELLSITPQMLFNYVNTVSEPVINQKEASDIFTDAIARANAKTILGIKQPAENGETTIKDEDDDDADEDEEVGEESYNRLSDFLRKRVDTSQPVKADKTDSPKTYSSGKVEIKTEDTTPEVLDITSDSESKENSAKSSTPEASSSNSNAGVKKLPMIRVANMKFLKGELPSPANNSTEPVENKANPIILKSNSPFFFRPDIKMMSSKRKVTFQEIEMSLKQAHIIAAVKKTSPGSSVKPPVT